MNEIEEEAPVFTSSATFNVDENYPSFSFGTVTATTSNGINASFSITGTEIRIDAGTGLLFFPVTT